jgi:hypothetical protein
MKVLFHANVKWCVVMLHFVIFGKFLWNLTEKVYKIFCSYIRFIEIETVVGELCVWSINVNCNNVLLETFWITNTFTNTTLTKWIETQTFIITSKMFTAFRNLKHKHIKYFIYSYLTDCCRYSDGKYLKLINLLIFFILINHSFTQLVVNYSLWSSGQSSWL